MRYVIMIGNGFDMGLGLKTAYSDFIDEYKIALLFIRGNVM